MIKLFFVTFKLYILIKSYGKFLFKTAKFL